MSISIDLQAVAKQQKTNPVLSNRKHSCSRSFFNIFSCCIKGKNKSTRKNLDVNLREKKVVFSPINDTNGFLKLPYDMVFLYTNYLSYKDVLNLSMTCKKAHYMLQKDNDKLYLSYHIWKRFLHRDFSILIKSDIALQIHPLIQYKENFLKKSRSIISLSLNKRYYDDKQKREEEYLKFLSFELSAYAYMSGYAVYYPTYV